MKELNFIIINKLAILVFILVFFLVVLVLKRLTRYKISIKLVSGTIKLTILGLVLLLFSVELKDIPIYGKTAHIIQNLIALICVANFVRYLIIEVFINLKWKGNPPSFLKDIATLLIYFLFAIISLRLVFNLDLSSVVTTSAVLTAGIAFAMQNTLANIISGLSIQLDKNLKLGNWVYVKDKDVYGEIINIGFRYTTLRTLENTIYIIPNNQLLQSPINIFEKTVDGFALYTNIGLRYEIPPDEAKKIITEVISNNQNISKHFEPKVFHNRYGDSAIEYKLKFYIDDFYKKDITIDSIHTQIWYAIKRAGYDFPYPHREIVHKKRLEEKQEELNLTAYLDKTIIFSYLNQSQKNIILNKSKKKTYGSGEIVVKQGEEGDSLFIVLKGLLNVLIDNEKVGTLKEGDFFGEYSLLTGESRKASVISQTESLLLEINKECLSEIFQSSPELVEQLEEVIIKRDEINKNFIAEKTPKNLYEEKLNSLSYKIKKFFGLIK
ncbi:MAG: mechanosensitive ion channel family protein [Proteobacteria bacterium]|nr:mechanosensitive ion channel family protein [Pseudomonadota bacterium]